MGILKQIQKRRDFARECAAVGDFNDKLYNGRLGDEMQALLDYAQACPERALPAQAAEVLADFLNEYAIEFNEFAGKSKPGMRRSEIIAVLHGQQL